MEEHAIDKLAKLAKLELSEDERKTFPGQIVSILDYVKKLEELDLPEDALQMAHVADTVNAWREDEAQNVSKEDQDLLIEAFPETVGRLNVVPAVFKRDG